MKNICIAFDLDGTLIDSREDIARSVNLLRKRFGLTPLPVEKVVTYIGNGVKKLVERAFADDPEDIAAADLATASASVASPCTTNVSARISSGIITPGVFVLNPRGVTHISLSRYSGRTARSRVDSVERKPRSTTPVLTHSITSSYVP